MAAEAWTSLIENYKVTTDMVAVAAEEDLCSTKYKEGQDLDLHIKTLWEKLNTVLNAGAVISDAAFWMIILVTLSRSWDPIVSTLYTSTTTAALISTLRTHWIRIRQRDVPASTALQVKMKPSNFWLQLQCSNPKCGHHGHVIADCYWPGGGKEGQFPVGFGKRGGGNTGTGGSTPVAAIANTGTEASYVLAVITDFPPDDLPATKAFLTMPQRTLTYADSGATDHCFANCKDFAMYTAYTSPCTGRTANKGGTFRILSVGEVKHSIIVNGWRTHLIFKSAVHTPDLSANLISISKFDDLGYFTTFGGGKVVFTDGEKRIIMEGRRTGGMYLLDMGNPLINVMGQGGPAAISARSHEKPIGLDTWHRCLGHAGMSTIKELLRKELVDGLIIEEDGNAPGKCEDCILGKHAAWLYDKEVEPKDEVLEHIHVDLWGPASVKSVGGALYLMVLVDGGSSMKFGYPLSHKTADLTLQVFTEFHLEAECMTEKKLQRVRVDLGRERWNKKWDDYLHGHGIIKEESTPYAHGQNGVAEHAIRTVIGSVRCLLFDARLSKSMWAEAAACSIYVQGFVPSNRHPGVVPLERWTGKKQDISHLHPFGCVAYAQVPMELVVSKLDPRSIKYIHIGYYDRGAYKLYDPASRSVIKAWNIIFEEGLSHLTLPLPPDFFPDPSPDTPTPPLDKVQCVSHPALPVAPCVCLTDPPLHPTCLTETTAGPAPIPATLPSLIPSPPPALHCSTRVQCLTTASREAEETLLQETEACEQGDDWVTDGETLQAFMADDDLHVPATYAEAMRHPDLWEGPICDELENLCSQGIFCVVKELSMLAGKKAIGCRWVFAHKYDAEEHVVKRKARLVVKGFSQIPGEDFNETYAAVAHLESFRIIMVVTAQKGLKTWQVDFVSAYLNSPCKYKVYMQIPPGFVVPQGEEEVEDLTNCQWLGPNTVPYVWTLDKTVYGMMQGPYDWFGELEDACNSIGYYRSRADSCIRSWVIIGEYMLTSTHTDNVFGVSSSSEDVAEAKAELDRCFKIKDLGMPSVILGMKIYQDPKSGTISLSQKAFLEWTLEHFGMTNCNPKSTPLPPGIDISDEMSPKTKEDQLYMMDKHYHLALGAVMWAQVAMCPDLSYAVNTLVRFQMNPGPGHWKALMHIYAYIQGTLDYAITYHHGDDASLKPVGYVDANYGGGSGSRRSTSGLYS